MGEAVEKLTLDLGPNGEQPYVHDPKILTLDDVIREERERRLLRGDPGIGSYRNLTPCVSSGRIDFKQIGAIRQVTKNIDLTDPWLLGARKPVQDGGVDEVNQPTYSRPAPTNDPSDYYSALWAMDNKVVRGVDLPMPPLDSWNEASQPNGDAPWSVGSAGDYIAMSAGSRVENQFWGWSGSTPVFRDVYYPATAFAITYIGRIAPGTRLVFYWEWYGRGHQYYTTDRYLNIRGWRSGWFGGDHLEYHALVQGGRLSNWRSEMREIVVDSQYSDIWIAFQVTGSDKTTTSTSCNFRKFSCWRA